MIGPKDPFDRSHWAESQDARIREEDLTEDEVGQMRALAYKRQVGQLQADNAALKEQQILDRVQMRKLREAARSAWTGQEAPTPDAGEGTDGD